MEKETWQEASLFYLSSIPKHSCLPNAIHITHHTVGLLRAVKDLKKGDEVFLDLGSPWAHPSTRMTSIMGHWGYSCCCSLCSLYFDNPSVLETRTRAANLFSVPKPTKDIGCILAIADDLELNGGGFLANWQLVDTLDHYF